MFQWHPVCKFSVISTCANSGSLRCAYTLFKADLGQVSGAAESTLVPNIGQVATAQVNSYFKPYHNVRFEFSKKEYLLIEHLRQTEMDFHHLLFVTHFSYLLLLIRYVKASCCYFLTSELFPSELYHNPIDLMRAKILLFLIPCTHKSIDAVSKAVSDPVSLLEHIGHSWY